MTAGKRHRLVRHRRAIDRMPRLPVDHHRGTAPSPHEAGNRANGSRLLGAGRYRQRDADRGGRQAVDVGHTTSTASGASRLPTCRDRTGTLTGPVFGRSGRSARCLSGWTPPPGDHECPGRGNRRTEPKAITTANVRHSASHACLPSADMVADKVLDKVLLIGPIRPGQL